MPDDMEPFQLDFAIPEIGAEVGDWIVPELDRARIVRTVPYWKLAPVIRRFRSVASAFGPLLHPPDEPPPKPRLHRLK